MHRGHDMMLAHLHLIACTGYAVAYIRSPDAREVGVRGAQVAIEQRTGFFFKLGVHMRHSRRVNPNDGQR